MSRRIAIFGGTFDPPHIGHLVTAIEVRYVGGFDEVVLMVANDPWQKSGVRQVTAADVRLEMVQAAVDGRNGLAVGDQEVRRGGATYSIDTVESVLSAEPDAELALVLGADAAAGLDTWHRAAELAELVEIVAVGRPGHGEPAVSSRWRVRRIEVPALDVSSTDLRARCAEGAPLDFLVPDAVATVIEGHGLYGVAR